MNDVNDIIYSDFVILAKEVNPTNGELFVRALDVEATPSLLHKLGLRSRFNPELEYYLTHRNNVVLTKRILEGKSLSNDIPKGTFEKI